MRTKRYPAYTISYVGQRLVPLLAILGAASIGLSSQDIGQAELILAGAALASVVAPLGTDQAIKLQRYRDNPNGIRVALAIAAGLGAAIGIVVGSISQPALSVNWWLAVALSAIAAMSRVSTERMRVDDRLTPLITSTILGLSGVAVVFLVHARGALDGATVPVAAVVLAYALGLLPMVGLIARLHPKGEPAPTRQLIEFGWPLVLAGASIWVLAAVDRYMLYWLSDTAAVGRYGVAARIVMLYSGVLSTVTIWWRNELFRDEAETRVRKRASTERFALVAIIMSALVAALIAAPLTAVVLRVVDIASTTQAAVLVIALLIGVVAWFAANLQLAPLTVDGHTRLVGGIWMTAALIDILLNIALIPALGPSGAAVATAAALSVAAVLATLGLAHTTRSNSA